ncbi:MAG: dTMP kinase [Verrucomicrobiae bacterium]|nr:dTMP kinase [Verrucomicrobiae bacterium]
MRASPGCFITFEGSEGSGKSTQIRRLAVRLRRNGHRVRVTREPGGTPIGRKIRHLLQFSRAGRAMAAETELLLFGADRAQHTRETIGPALARGEVVISDRYADSTTAYQGAGRRLGRGFVECLNRFATAGLKPRLTFVLDLDPEEGLRRARKKTRRTDRMEAQRAAFYRAVRAGFQRLARTEARRVKRVDARAGVEEVAARVWALLPAKLQKPAPHRERGARRKRRLDFLENTPRMKRRSPTLERRT